MVGSVVQQVGALAQAVQVAQPVVGRIVIQMRCSEDDPRRVLPR
jgi:hypothetical protein